MLTCQAHPVILSNLVARMKLFRRSVTEQLCVEGGSEGLLLNRPDFPYRCEGARKFTCAD
jgi:hypothetical protein